MSAREGAPRRRASRHGRPSAARAATPPFSLQRAVQELSPRAKYVAEQRLATLMYNFERYHPYFFLRDDSKLAFLYATRATAQSLHEVMVDMIVAQWLHATTPYAAYLQIALRQLADEAKRRYGLRDWTAIWNVVRGYGSDIVKYECIAQVGCLPADVLEDLQQLLSGGPPIAAG